MIKHKLYKLKYSIRYADLLLISFVGILFIIWPIPHTITIRYLLILIILPLLGFVLYKNKSKINVLNILKTPLVIYVLLSLWILFVAVFISQETAWSIGEIRGQWLPASLSLLIGILLAVIYIDNWRYTLILITSLFVILVFYVLYLDAGAILELVKGNPLPTRIAGLTVGPDKANFISNILISFLFTELVFRINLKKKILPFNNWLLAAIIVLTLFSIYLEFVRNGFLVFIVLSGIFLLVTTELNWQRLKTPTHIIGIALVILISISTIFFSLKVDDRWRTFIETIPIALDTKTHKAWLDREKHPTPTLLDGTKVNESNYERISWIKEGLLLVADYPLGYGYGRRAFGHAIQKKYGLGVGGGHSHSGFVDLAVGTGIPGILLWYGFLLILIIKAYKSFKRSRNFSALLLIFIIVDFGFRMFVDSINKDHMLQQFLFLVGLLAVTGLNREIVNLNLKNTTSEASRRQ